MLFTLKFNQTNQLIPVQFASSTESIKLGFENLQIVNVREDVEHYKGSYDITPLITAQIMPTSNKFMDDDVRIEMIPTRELDNEAGGVTFIVG